MAKGSSMWTDQLVSLLGLDKETVNVQILPFLDSFDDQASLCTHLQGLVGTETPLAKSFVRDFTRSRFPQQPSTSGSTTPTLRSATTGDGTAHVTAPKKRGKRTLAERAGIGHTLAPRKLQESDLDEQEHMARLSEAFGGMGTVYKKKQDQDDFFVGTAKGKKAKQPGSRQIASVRSVDAPARHQSDLTAAAKASPDETLYTTSIIDHDETSTSPSLAKSQPSPPPTSEMLAIDAVIEELTSTSAFDSSSSTLTAMPRKMCFCQGRRHPLAPYAPLCYSCGLILCSALHPSPLSLLSSCPSCSTSPLLGASARSDLVNKLSAEREVLFEQQLLQIQLQREQKKINKTSAHSAREEEAALFPQLGKDASTAAAAGSSVPQAAPVMGKHGALQKARAIAGDAQRTAKVLSLDMKTHKVKTHTKVTRPKAVVQPEASVVDSQAQKEQDVNKDPFVGLDGSTLVKNEMDDGLSGERGRMSRVRFNLEKGAQAIPSREWCFSGAPFTLRPTARSY